ncbi:MAG TPA: hypothetical protein VKH61_14140 [Streptosporangiaceae bacterium]|nr:hypothetical protein [Streptosporangiaceae bacterium]
MQLLGDDQVFLVRWRQKAGHYEDEDWISEDGPDERSGPFGKIHAKAEGAPLTRCGKPVPTGPGHSESLSRADLAGLCHPCLRLILKPYL